MYLCALSWAYSVFVPMPRSTGLLQIYFYILPVLNGLAIFTAIWPVCMFQPMRHARAGGKRDQLAEFYEFKTVFLIALKTVFLIALRSVFLITFKPVFLIELKTIFYVANPH